MTVINFISVDLACGSFKSRRWMSLRLEPSAHVALQYTLAQLLSSAHYFRKVERRLASSRSLGSKLKSAFSAAGPRNVPPRAKPRLRE